jgi:hypothetical protein
MNHKIMSRNMNLKHALRALLGIRQARRIPLPGPIPKVGGSIVLNNLRIRLRHPIDHEEWAWLINKGWRSIDMRTNRRAYTLVPNDIVFTMFSKDKTRRETIHSNLTTEPSLADFKNIFNDGIAMI